MLTDDTNILTKLNQYHFVDLMSINHFLIYFAIGIKYKNKFKIILLMSILWEIVEYIISHIDYTKNLVIKYWIVDEYYWNEKNIYHKLGDIIINMAGYYTSNKYI